MKGRLELPALPPDTNKIPNLVNPCLQWRGIHLVALDLILVVKVIQECQVFLLEGFFKNNY